MGEEDASSTYRELVGALRSITMFHSDKTDIDINLIIDNQGATRILSIGSRVEALQRRFDVLYTQFGGVNVHDVPGVRSVEGSVDHVSTAHTCTLSARSPVHSTASHRGP